MGIKEYRATGGNAALLKDYHRRSDSLAQWQINFLPYKDQQYAFDYLDSGNHGIYSGSEYYPYLNSNYDLRYKSIECFKTDKVVVDFGCYLEKDSIIFKDKYGVKYKLADGNVLNFTGVAKADTNYIYAYRGDEKIGKLSVNTYKKKSYKVVLVSVNGAELLDISKVIDCLHKVYKQAVDTFEIKTDTLTVNGLDKFSHGGSGVLTVYNDDQKTVLRAYDSEMENGVYYLFFIDNVTDKKDGNGTMVSGYMPRGYNAGFIYDKGSPHTIAHELGHGIAGLEHVFENSKSSGKTKNLMDYSEGEELWHFQWDAIQDPSRVWMKWNKDESEGEWFKADTITDAIVKTGRIEFQDSLGALTFLTPAGLPITLPPSLSQVSFVSIIDECPDGALTKFYIGNDAYVAHYLTAKENNKIKFNGYIHYPLYDKYYENENVNYRPENVILGYNYECNIELLSMEYSKLSDNFSKITKLGAGEVKLRNISYPRLGLKYLVNISDEEACSLKTDLAKDFYQKEIGKVALTANETNSNSIIHRIAVVIDNALLNNSSAELRLNEFINDVLTKNNYLESKWTVTDYEKLKNYLEYYVNSCTHEESLFLSSSFEGNKFVGIFGFNQSLEQVLSDYSNSSNVEIICKLLKISCLVGNQNASSILKNIKKDDYAKFIENIYVEDNDILESKIADSRCLFDLVLVKFEELKTMPNFANLMWNIVMYNDKSNDKFEVFKQFNDNIPYYAMTSFLENKGFTLFMSVEARKKLLKYYSQLTFILSEDDINVIGRIVNGISNEDIVEILSFLLDSELNRSSLFVILSKFKDDNYLSIPIELRLKLLMLFSNCYLTQAYFGSVDDEIIVVNLIKYTPDNDAKQLLDFFFQNNGKTKNYFEIFKSGIDGNNYLLYLVALCEKWNMVHNSEILIFQKDFDKYAKSLYVWDKQLNYSTSISNNKILIRWKLYKKDISNFYINSVTEQSELNYDDAIILSLLSIPDLLFSNFSKKDFFEGAYVMIPAFLFQSIIDKTNMNSRINDLDAFITVVSLLYGVTELKAFCSLSSSRKFMVLLGLTMDGYSIATKNADINEWVEKAFASVRHSKEEGLLYKRRWETIINLMDIKNIVSIKYSDFKKVKDDFDAFKIGLASFKQDYFIGSNVISSEDEQMKLYIDDVLSTVIIYYPELGDEK